MSDIVGGKAKPINIPAPVNKKLRGVITKIQLSQKYEHYVDITVEFPEYKARSDDGKKEFVKRCYYGIPVDWSEKNKAGKLLLALYGKLPSKDGVNWSKALLNKEVSCILEDVLDEQTGEPKGQKIKWIGKVGSSPEPAAGEVPEVDFDSPEFSGDPQINHEVNEEDII